MTSMFVLREAGAMLEAHPPHDLCSTSTCLVALQADSVDAWARRDLPSSQSFADRGLFNEQSRGSVYRCGMTRYWVWWTGRFMDVWPHSTYCTTVRTILSQLHVLYTVRTIHTAHCTHSTLFPCLWCWGFIFNICSPHLLILIQVFIRCTALN